MKNMDRFVGFEMIKRFVSISQVLQHYGLLEQLQRRGDSLTGSCPLHQGHNKWQFRVSLSKNCWICFGDCHVGGSIIDFVSRKEGIGVREAGVLIQDWFGISHEQVQSAQTQQVGLRPLSDPMLLREGGSNPPLRFALDRLDTRHRYLHERRLSRDTIETFGLGYCPRGWLAGWIVIPIHNSAGQLIAYAGRWPGKPPEGNSRYMLPKGFRKSLELFNLHRASTADARLPLVVVEGFFDCMNVWQAGYRRVVALMGSMLSLAQEEIILKAAGPGGRVVLMFDEDEAGRKGRELAQSRLDQWLNVSVITLEHGAQPDQLSTEALQDLLGMRETADEA